MSFDANDPTIHVLPPDRIHPVELNEDGECPMDHYVTGLRAVISIFVCGPFDPKNNTRRVLPKPIEPTTWVPDGVHAKCAVWRRYVLNPGDPPVPIPRCYRMAIRRTRCVDCRPLVAGRCVNEEHTREVIGGLAPFVQLVGEVGGPTLHPSLAAENPAPAAEPARPAAP
ncbi:MAG TPA: hypothetical protein VIY73_02790, partial [Polyangiaceae bacterium]